MPPQCNSGSVSCPDFEYSFLYLSFKPTWLYILIGLQGHSYVVVDSIGTY